MTDISFVSEDISFDLEQANRVTTWLVGVCSSDDRKLESLCYVFCSDAYLLDMNKKYLNHDYFTDIITFDYCDESSIGGDIFISIDRVQENAKEFGVSSTDELHRVMVHGLLHLMGWMDKSDSDKAEMRNQEEKSLSLRDFIND